MKRTTAVTSKPSRELSQTEENQQDRRGRRLALSCRLFFFGDDDFEGEAKILDISTNGCSAESSIDVTVGMLLKLSLFLPDFKWPLRVDQAIVRWIDGKQFGLEFTSIRLAQRERLRGLIMKARL
ncbi:MAG: PilZ domain-containing protein [Nitrospira sp.]|nr:MAG: PilZ domain-containing protein [Nitrospira sp.]